MLNVAVLCGCGFFAALGAGQAYADVVAPTSFQIDPGWEQCYQAADSPATDHAVTGTDSDGNLTGWAVRNDHLCRLYVHSGRGPGYVIASACAAVVWSPTTGEILSIATTGIVHGYSIPCP